MSRFHPPALVHRGAGFTLLEMLVVLVLAAITATVVGGGAQSVMDRSRYHQTVRDVARLLNEGRTLCLQEGREVAVTYQPQSQQLTVDGRLHVNIPPSLLVQWEPIQQHAKSTQEAGELIFVFNAEGGARSGKLAVLRGGQGVAFRVNWLLGSIEQTVAAAKS